jgi:hypothetical protein
VADAGDGRTTDNFSEVIKPQERRNPLTQNLPRHYDLRVWTVDEATRFLDTKYELGWRVVKMVPQPGRDRKIIFLFEKIAAAKKG